MDEQGKAAAEAADPDKTPRTKKTAAAVGVEKVGWTVTEWLAALGRGRTWFYTLPLEQRPKSVRLGKSDLIVEPPGEYLAEMLRKQSAESKRAMKAATKAAIEATAARQGGA